MSSPLRLAAALALLAAVSACSARTGDFGRPDPAVSSFAPLPKPGPTFNETDEEVLMHDRIHRFLYAPHVQGWFVRELAVVRRAALTAKELDRERGTYYRWLSATHYRSSRTRYNAMAADIQADVDTVPATFDAICAVEEIDRQRGLALAEVGAIEPGTENRVARRAQDNDEAIADFAAALSFRYDAYSYALENLLVETPHDEAITVDRLLSTLAAYVGEAETQNFCADPNPVVVLR